MIVKHDAILYDPSFNICCLYFWLETRVHNLTPVVFLSLSRSPIINLTKALCQGNRLRDDPTFNTWHGIDQKHEVHKLMFVTLIIGQGHPHLRHLLHYDSKTGCYIWWLSIYGNSNQKPKYTFQLVTLKSSSWWPISQLSQALVLVKYRYMYHIKFHYISFNIY